MLPLIFLSFSLVYSCTQTCKLYCANHSPTVSCLSSCNCQLASSKPLKSIYQYSTWNCSYTIIDACNYSTDFDSCMKSANCAYLPSSDLIYSKIPESSLLIVETLSNPELKVNKLVICSDCKIFEGDDYWECIAEYCQNLEIEGLYSQIKGNVGDQTKMTVGISLGNSLCCVHEQVAEEIEIKCTSQCEIKDEKDFFNMKKVRKIEFQNFNARFAQLNIKNTEKSGIFTYTTLSLLLAGAGLIVLFAVKPNKTEDNPKYHILI